MSIDKIISESLDERAGELKIPDHKYEAMLEYIEKRTEKQRESAGSKLLKRIRNIIAALHIKDLVEVAAFILVLIAVPVMVSHSNSILSKANNNKETKEIVNASGSLAGTIDPKTINIKQAAADGWVVMVANSDNVGGFDVYNIDKLDRFMENSKKGEKDRVRVIKFTMDKANALVNSIVDLNYDGSRVESVGYDLYSDKTVYKATAPTYFAKITRTEPKDGVRYALCLTAEEADNMGATLLSYTIVKENNVEVNQNISELKLSPEATAKYLKDNKYEVIPSGEAGAIIILPDSFNFEKGGIKLGSMLKDMNESSKREANLDFSPYLGKTVYMYTARVKKESSLEKSMLILAYGDKIIAAWTQSNTASEPDFNLLNSNIGEKTTDSGTSKVNSSAVKLSSEASSKYLKDKNYEIVANSGAGLIIQLPDNFSAEKNGVKIGELLKDRNEKSKNEAKLDFSQYLGKNVYLYTAALKKDNVQDRDILILSWGDKVIGVWTYPSIQAYESRQSDFSLLRETLKQ